MWHESLDKNVFISNLYNEIPELKNVRIAQIKIVDEGDRVTLVFDMPYFADKPPKKWIDAGYNTTIVYLDFFDIREINLKTVNNRYKGNIQITKDTDSTFTIFVTGSVEAKIKAGIGMIQSIEGYCNQLE